MRSFRLALLTLLLSASCIRFFAQTTPTTTPTPSAEDTAQREKLDALIQQDLDETIAGTTSLRLPENRAIAYAMLGDMYWRFDQKKSRELFRNAGTELSAYNVDADKDAAEARALQPAYDVMGLTTDPRYQVIPLIAKHDADLGLQIMQQTRRSLIANALTNAPQMTVQEGIIGLNGFGAANVLASQELALEQQIAGFAADQDPELAMRLIKDSLSRGISYNLLPLLQKLARLDDKKAAELSSEVVQKILDSDMVKSQDSLRTGINFLLYSTRVPTAPGAQVKQFNFTDAQQKDIANKLVTSLLAIPVTTSANTWFTQVIPLVDKIVPDRSALLRQRQAEIQRSMPTDIQRNQQRQDMFSSGMTADQIVALLPKLSDQDKTNAYMALQNKIGGITDEAQAKKLIDQIPDEKVRSAFQQQLDAARADREIQTGRLDDARRQIAQMADHRLQIQKYVALALAYNKSGKEADVDAARSILRDAKALTANFPESGDDLGELMDIVRGYAVVEPDAAFRILDPGIDMINEYVQAAAVISRYSKDRNFRNGELVFRPNGVSLPIFRYLGQMQLLGKADLDRANQAVDRFSRADAKMIVRLYILQGATPLLPQRPVGSQ